MSITCNIKKLTLFFHDKQKVFRSKKIYIFFLLLTLVNMKIITFPVKGVLLQKSNYVFTQILLYCRGSKMNYFELITIIVRSMMLM